jgi:hypothetical protein
MRIGPSSSCERNEAPPTSVAQIDHRLGQWIRRRLCAADATSSASNDLKKRSPRPKRYGPFCRS